MITFKGEKMLNVFDTQKKYVNKMETARFEFEYCRKKPNKISYILVSMVTEWQIIKIYQSLHSIL